MTSPPVPPSRSRRWGRPASQLRAVPASSPYMRVGQHGDRDADGAEHAELERGRARRRGRRTAAARRCRTRIAFGLVSPTTNPSRRICPAWSHRGGVEHGRQRAPVPDRLDAELHDVGRTREAQDVVGRLSSAPPAPPRRPPRAAAARGCLRQLPNTVSTAAWRPRVTPRLITKSTLGPGISTNTQQVRAKATSVSESAIRGRLRGGVPDPTNRIGR